MKRAELGYKYLDLLDFLGNFIFSRVYYKSGIYIPFPNIRTNFCIFYVFLNIMYMLYAFTFPINAWTYAVQLLASKVGYRFV